MKILVTGAGGQLGKALRDSSAASGYELILTDAVPRDGMLVLDVTSRDDVLAFISEHKVGAVINCAAYTDVNGAEDDLQKAELINSYAPSVLAEAAARTGAVLIHISTDYVFDGQKNTPYTETDTPSPLSAYGKTKLAGDMAVCASGCSYVILRTAWMYSCYGRNFFNTIVDRTAENPNIKVVVDQIGTPTYAPDLADAIFRILETGVSGREGIYNFTGEGLCSWYDFAVAICNGVGHLCRISPCHTSDYPAKASRPHYSVLDKSRIRSVFGIDIPHWTESLNMCIMDYEKTVTSGC